MRFHDTITCPACGQRSSAADPNHFEPFGRWEGRAVVTCRACGSGLAVSPRLQGALVTQIDPNLWSSLKEVRQFAPPGPRARMAPEQSGSASTDAQDLRAAARELDDARGKIQGALDLLKTLQVNRHDPRTMALHGSLVSSLVLVRDLILDTRDDIKARGGADPDEADAW